MFKRSCGRLLIHLAICAPLSLGGQTRPAPLPYTAEFKVTHTEPPGNGDNALAEESTVIRARDSQGRYLWSRTAVPRSNAEAPVTRITVTDGRARSYMAWNIPGNEVIVQESPGYELLAKRCAEEHKEVPSVPHDRPQYLNLGIRTIAGVKARGGRTMVSLTRVGGEPLLVRSQEVWIAIVPGLEGLTPLVVVETPADGKTTQEMVQFDQSEPSPALFQPPAEYTVIHRTAEEAPCSALPTPVPITPSSTQLPSVPR